MPIYKKIGIGALIALLTGFAQLSLWQWLHPLIWVLFYPAIILSARLGGVVSSLVTALTACFMVYYVFVSPSFVLVGKDLNTLISAPIFLLAAYMVGHIHEQYHNLSNLLKSKLRTSQQDLETLTKLHTQELALEELKFSDFAESLPQIVWVTNADGDNIYFNQKWMDYTGMSLEESMGKGWNLPFHPDDKVRAWEAWDNAVHRNAVYSLECRLRRADGEYTWWLIRAVPLLDSFGNVSKWFGTCTDIHTLKTTLNDLASEKSKLENIFENHPDGVAFLESNGVYGLVNARYPKFYGFEDASKLPATYTELMKSYDVFELNGRPIPLNEMPVMLSLKGTSVNGFEAIIVCKATGVRCYVSISANPLFTTDHSSVSGAISSVRDITANIQDKAELIQLINEQNLMLSSGIAGIAKTKDRTYVWVNEVFAKNFGYKVDELIGQSTEMLYESKGAFNDFGNKISTASIFEGGLIRDVLYLKRKDGSYGWFLVGGGPVAKGSNESIWLSIDVTEERKNQELLNTYVKRIEHSMHETLEVLAKTVEMHDPYTAGHQRRVGQIAKDIGRAMGLAPEALNNLELMGLIHDIGKIGIPAEILSKPGRLSPEELVLVRAHTRIGHDILSQVNFDIPVAEVAFQHHERIDGSGYPNGLHDSQILLESRIIAVADVLEAMSSHRPYRPALGLDKALEELLAGRGTKYDSEVVDACMRLFNEENYQIANAD